MAESSNKELRNQSLIRRQVLRRTTQQGNCTCSVQTLKIWGCVCKPAAHLADYTLNLEGTSTQRGFYIMASQIRPRGQKEISGLKKSLTQLYSK